MSVSRRVRCFLFIGAFAACRSRSVPEATGELAEPPASCAIPARAEEPKEPVRSATSILGAPLATCGTSPMTGVYRDGRCATGPDDVGVHVVCARVTDAFLRFTAAHGNDLSTSRSGFQGLRAGDRWCLCAARWAEADAAGVAPPVVLAATETAALRSIDRVKLESRAAP